jgi:hypothetical protein
MVLHHSDHIADSLIKHILMPNTMIMEPLVDLIVVFAVDLQEDFVTKYFSRVLETLVSLINPANPEQTSTIFHGISMLFKYCSKWLVDDLSAVRAHYSAILGSKKEYVRNFAAESFAYLLRKLKAKVAVAHIKTLSKALEGVRGAKNETDLVDGVASLLYETMRSAASRLHSRFPPLFAAVISSFDATKTHGNEDDGEEVTSPEEALVLSFDMSHLMLERLLEYTRAEYCEDVWDILSTAIQNAVQSWKNSIGASVGRESSRSTLLISEYTYRLLKLFTLCVDHRFGSRLGTKGHQEVTKIISLVTQKDVYHSSHWSDKCRQQSLLLFRGFWKYVTRVNDQTKVEGFKGMLATTAATFAAIPTGHSFSRSVEQGIISFVTVLTPQVWCTVWLAPLLTYLGALSAHSPNECIPVLVRVFDLVDFKTLITSGLLNDDVIFISPKGRLRCGNVSSSIRSQLGAVETKKKKSKEVKTTEEDARSLLSALLSLALSKDVSPASLWGILRVLPHVEIPSEIVSPLLTALESSMKTIKDDHRGTLYSEFLALRSSYLDSMDGEEVKALMEDGVKLVVSFPTDPFVLANAVHVLQAIVNSAKGQLHGKDFTSMSSCLAAAQSSSSHLLRVNALRILTLYDKFEFSKGAGSASVYNGPCLIMNDVLRLEEAEPSLAAEREYSLLLERVCNIVRSGQMPHQYVSPLTHALLGLFHVKFSVLWTSVSKAVTACAECYFDVAWPIIYSTLKDASGIYSHDTAGDGEVEAGESVQVSLVLEDMYSNSKTCNSLDGTSSQRGSTDADTFHATLWKCLASFPQKAESRNADIVRLFFIFLRDDYYGSSHQNDPEASDLVLDKATNLPKNEHSVRRSNENTKLSCKATGNRLRSFIAFFAAVKNAKGLYCHDILMSLWQRLLTKSDTAVQKSALECLLNFKSEGLVKYADQLRALTNDDNFRDAMLAFPLAKDGGILLDVHRASVLPVVCRILYGKMVRRLGKNSKETLRARRGAVLLYWSAVEPNELIHMIKLLLRAFTVSEMPQRIPTTKKDVQQILSSIDVTRVPVQRRIGFLQLMDEFCSKMGKTAQPLLHLPLGVIAACLRDASNRLVAEKEAMMIDDGDDVDDGEGKSDAVEGGTIEDKAGDEVEDVAGAADDEDEVAEGSIALNKVEAKTIFNLAIVRISDIILTYQGYNLALWADDLFKPLEVGIANLAIASQGAVKPHALLKLADIATRSVDTCKVFDYCPDLLPMSFAALSVGIEAHVPAGPNVVSTILNIIEHLLASDVSQPRLIPYIASLLGHFTARLKIGHFAERELNILSAIASYTLKDMSCIDEDLATSLFSLLLPYLGKTGRSAPSDNARISILTTTGSLAGAVKSPEKHIAFVSSLLGPGPLCVTHVGARKALVSLVDSLGNHASLKWFREPATLVVQLNAMSMKRIGEPDLDVRMDAYEKLRGGVIFEYAKVHQYSITPLLQQLLRDATEEDRSLRSCAVSVLEKVIDEASNSSSPNYDLVRESLLHLIMPGVKKAIRQCREDTQRRSLLLILRYIVKANPDCSALHGDLSVLISEEQDTDFFDAIVHMQFHRRAKALVRLQSVVKDVSLSSIVNFLLPITMHMIFESDRVLQQQLRSDAIDTLGVISVHLSWSYYMQTVRTLLSQIPRKPEMEKWLLRAVCAVIDGFHFDLNDASPLVNQHFEEEQAQIAQDEAEVEVVVEGENTATDADAEGLNKKDPASSGGADNEEEESDESDEDDEDLEEGAENGAVEVVKRGGDTKKKKSTRIRGPKKPKKVVGPVISETGNKPLDMLLNKLLPDLKKFMVKPGEEGKSAHLRVAVALAVIKVIMKLPKKISDTLIPGVLIDVCGVLTSKLQDVRDETKDTLVKIMKDLGIGYLKPFLNSIKVILANGYQKQVLGHVVYEVLEALVPVMTPSLLTDEEIRLVEALNAANSAVIAAKQNKGEEEVD